MGTDELSASPCELGMVGLGAMGRNLLLNLADHGFPVAGYDKDLEKVAALQQELRGAVQADYVVRGGGNARLMGKLPPKTQLGNNANAFKGGARLWQRAYCDSNKERFLHGALCCPADI